MQAADATTFTDVVKGDNLCTEDGCSPSCKVGSVDARRIRLGCCVRAVGGSIPGRLINFWVLFLWRRLACVCVCCFVCVRGRWFDPE